MIKGEYAETIGPKGQFKKHWQLRLIAEYEKFLGNCAAVKERLDARGGLSLFCLHTVTCDLINKEESTYHYLCVTSQTNTNVKHILLGNYK